jgi:hypothetical protein
VATLIGLRQKPGRTGFAQTSAITSNEPNAPFKSVSVKSTIGRDAGQTPLTETTELCREDDDRQAIDRGEDEGTTVVPE